MSGLLNASYLERGSHARRITAGEPHPNACRDTRQTSHSTVAGGRQATAQLCSTPRDTFLCATPLADKQLRTSLMLKHT